MIVDMSVLCVQVLTKTPTRIGMIAGGSGITPMLQIIRYFSTHRNVVPLVQPIRLLYFNVSPLDIPFHQELSDLQYEGHIEVTFFVNADVNDASKSVYARIGLIEQNHIQELLPPPSDETLQLVCGPKDMVKLVQKLLTDLQYSSDQVYTF